jgi:hypothetical protein
MGKWIKYGGVEIYESKHGLIVGGGRHLYAVYGDKHGTRGDKLWIYPSGWIKSDQTHCYAGSYKTKQKAIDLLNKLEASYYLKGVKVFEVDDKDIENSMSSLTDRKGGGFLIIKKGDEIGKAHELGHIKAGHHINTKGVEGNYNKEVEAVGNQIEYLKDKGIYTGVVRNKIVRDLSTYDKKKSKVRARKDIKKIEARLGLV